MPKKNAPLLQTVTKDPVVIAQLRADFGEAFNQDNQVVKGKEAKAKAFLERIHSPEVGIPPSLPVKDVGILIEYLYETYTTTPEYSEGTTTTTELPSQARPDIIALKEMQEAQEKQQAKRAEAAESDEEVRRAIERQKAIYKDQLEKTRAAEEALKKRAEEASVYVKRKPEPTGDTKKIVNDLREKISDPKKAVEAIEAIGDELQERSKDKTIPEEDFQLAAIYTAINIAGPSPSVNSSVTKYAAERGLKIGGVELKDPAEILYRQDSSLRDMSMKLDGVFGKEFVETVFPEYQVSETPQPGYFSAPISFIPREAAKRIETEAAVLNNPTTTPEKETQDFIERWMDQMGQGTTPQGITAQRVTYQETTTTLELLPQGESTTLEAIGGYAATQNSIGLSQPLALIGRFAAQKALTKVGSQIAVKTGLKAAITSATTAASTAIPVPILNWIVGFVGGEIIGRILDSKLVKNISKYSAILIGGIAGIIGFIFFGIGGGLALGIGSTLMSAAFGAGTGGITAAGIGGGIAGVIGAVAGATLGAVGGPILATLIGFPIVVALILFIINSGAYIVPPAPSLSAALESPYIGVTKTANPAGPFENSALPLSVEYRVEIRAKKGPLTDVKIEYECAVVKDGPATQCPDPDPAIPTSVDGGISPAGAFSFTYKVEYPSPEFEDSFVTDVITVTANSTEEEGAQAAGSATIKIGEPPEDCPSSWPTSHGYLTQGARTPASCGNNCSHSVLEALDIGVSSVGVKATHTGVVVTAQRDSCLGNYVQIRSNCGGKDFISRYAHLEGISAKAGVGKTVTMGDQIGLSGNTGRCTTGPHLHYEFRYWPNGTPSWSKNPPYMMTPYIPQDVPRGCRTTGECGVSY